MEQGVSWKIHVRESRYELHVILPERIQYVIGSFLNDLMFRRYLGMLTTCFLEDNADIIATFKLPSCHSRNH